MSRWIGHPFLWAIVSLPLSGLSITPHSGLQNMLYQLHFLDEETEAQRSCNFCVLPLGLWIAQCSVHYPVLPPLYRDCGTSSHMQSSTSRAPDPLLFLHHFRARVPPEVVRLLLWGQKEVGKAPLVKGSVASRFVCCVCVLPLTFGQVLWRVCKWDHPGPHFYTVGFLVSGFLSAPFPLSTLSLGSLT